MGIGGQVAVESADECAERQNGEDRDDPDGRMSDAEGGRKLINLQHAACDGNQAQHRTNRQVDLPHDDDERHACGHDGDRSRLVEQGPEIAGGEERAAEQAAEVSTQDAAGNVEGAPDQHQRHDHANHARVDLGGIEKTANWAVVSQRGARARTRLFGHAVPPLSVAAN